MEIYFNMIDLMDGDNCKCFKHGKIFHDRIKEILSGLEEDNKIVISLEGISVVSSSFAYTAFLPLTKWIGQGLQILSWDKVRFVDWDEEQKKTIDEMVGVIKAKAAFGHLYPTESLCKF